MRHLNNGKLEDVKFYMWLILRSRSAKTVMTDQLRAFHTKTLIDI